MLLAMRRPAAVFDIDDTIFDASKRLREALRKAGVRGTSSPNLRGPQREVFWRFFLSEELLPLDAPHASVVRLVRSKKKSGLAIILVTGRPERLRRATIRQLDEAGVPFDELHMRREGDRRPEAEFKVEVVRRLSKSWDVREFHDNNPEVIEAVARLLPNADLFIHSRGRWRVWRRLA
ncbi:MAG TPA: hypothetical protein ENG69_00095 [Candidatus Korarchaeota archaeon]|nr:hypothetical protein [Candidatus Korarchaeota archaeon]